VPETLGYKTVCLEKSLMIVPGLSILFFLWLAMQVMLLTNAFIRQKTKQGLTPHKLLL